MTPLQEKSLRAILERQRAATKRISKKAARGEVYDKTLREIDKRYDDEIIALVRGMLSTSRGALPGTTHR